MRVLFMVLFAVACGSPPSGELVVVAAHDVNPGEVVRANDVMLVAMDPSVLRTMVMPAQGEVVFRTRGGVDGLVATHGLRRFELVLKDRLSTAQGVPVADLAHGGDAFGSTP